MHSMKKKEEKKKKPISQGLIDKIEQKKNLQWYWSTQRVFISVRKTCPLRNVLSFPKYTSSACFPIRMRVTLPVKKKKRKKKLKEKGHTTNMIELNAISGLNLVCEEKNDE